MKITFLVSKNGGNLKFFYLAVQKKIINDIELTVIGDRECGAIDFARNNNIQNFIIEYKRASPDTLRTLLDKINPDVVITTWHKIIDRSTVEYFKGRLVNLHYSLLPAYSGLIGIEAIRMAYEHGVGYIGPTCHFVDEGVDTGKIISQAIFKTDIAIVSAINMMFRKGCFVLLNGIQLISNERLLISRKEISNICYSPSLCFEESIFSAEFWDEVAKL